MLITATELNKRPGTYLDKASREPIVIEKSGRRAVVMVSYEHYVKLEDTYWGELAVKADAEKSLGVKRSMDFLTGDE